MKLKVRYMRLKVRYILLALLVVTAVTGCNSTTSEKVNSDNQPQVNSDANQESDRLPKDINILIGRGGCCYGHIISIDRNGDLEYFVGQYNLPVDKNSISKGIMPEIFNPDLVKMDKRYSPKYRKVPLDNLRQLAQLIREEKKLHFRDETMVTDAYLYHLYINKKKVAYGYDLNLEVFPENLQKLIKLILSEIKLHELPGMA